MKPKLLFFATEDWFFRSHFLFLAQRARQEGFEVVLAARSTNVFAAGEIRVVDLSFSRGSLNLWDVCRQVLRVRSLMSRENPDVIHVMGLRPILLVLFARIRRPGRVFALTGRGYLSVGRAVWTRLLRLGVQRLLRKEMSAPNSVLLVENAADARWVEDGRPLPARQVMLMPGAGVDARAYTVSPEPSVGPIIVGVAARLVWSKGVDVAVRAVQRLRAARHDVVLRIAGEPDFENPERVADKEINDWRAQTGIELLGHLADINAFWAGVHIACIPSRGGEGLPRALLEAAACGRPIITTDTPGCRDFASGAEVGIVVPASDVDACAEAIRSLLNDGGARRRFGAAARKLVEEAYTLEQAADRAAQSWRAASGLAL